MSTHFRQSSYYNRVVVPVDLRAILERGEILRSLRTKQYRVACSRGRLFEARLARLFHHLREHHHAMTPETIQALVRTHIDKSLEEVCRLYTRSILRLFALYVNGVKDRKEVGTLMDACAFDYEGWKKLQIKTDYHLMVTHLASDSAPVTALPSSP